MVFFIPDLVKIRRVENEEEFVLVLKSLYCMGNTLWKIPNVAVAEFRNFVFAIFVDRRHSDAAGIDDTPFSLWYKG